MSNKIVCNYTLVLLFIVQIASTGFSSVAHAQNPAENQKIAIDIPVHLKNAKVLFDVSRPDFAGDVPVAFKYMNLMAKLFAKEGTEANIIGVFYAEAAYFLLNDALYNARRGVTTGNPYKTLIAHIQEAGVQLEMCVNAMKEQNIRKEDLLPGVKVNGGANLRMVQLEQEGFTRLQP
jgi:uncharacterized protein